MQAANPQRPHRLASELRLVRKPSFVSGRPLENSPRRDAPRVLRHRQVEGTANDIHSILVRRRMGGCGRREGLTYVRSVLNQQGKNFTAA